MCEWCGSDHPVTALCTKRPRWSRRGFIGLFGVGLAALAVDPATLLQPLIQPAYALGTRATDQAGNVYRYVKGLGQLTVGDVLSSHPGTIGGVVCDHPGRRGDYGWVQTFGACQINISGPQDWIQGSVNTESAPPPPNRAARRARYLRANP